MTTTYETTGDTPARTLTQRIDGEVTLMLTEIGDGVFVGWDHCDLCRQRVVECRCVGGPQERDFIARWRQERLDTAAGRVPNSIASVPELDDPEPDPEPEAEPEAQDSDTRQKFDAGVEAVKRAARAAEIPVEF